MSTWLNIAIILLLVWWAMRMFAPVKGLETLSPRQFRERLEQAGPHLLVDVREVHEYRNGHLPGAVNIPLSQLKNRLAEIPRENTVLLYCQSGMRSRQAGKILGGSGHRAIAHLRGGISAWDGKVQR